MHFRSVSSLLPGTLLCGPGEGTSRQPLCRRERVRTLPFGIFLFFLVFFASQLWAGKEPARANGFATYVDIPGASRVGSDTCTACHTDTSKNFQHAFHKQQGGRAPGAS
jgi:hypothetical protein